MQNNFKMIGKYLINKFEFFVNLLVQKISSQKILIKNALTSFAFVDIIIHWIVDPQQSG